MFKIWKNSAIKLSKFKVCLKFGLTKKKNEKNGYNF